MITCEFCRDDEQLLNRQFYLSYATISSAAFVFEFVSHDFRTSFSSLLSLCLSFSFVANRERRKSSTKTVCSSLRCSFCFLLLEIQIRRHEAILLLLLLELRNPFLLRRFLVTALVANRRLLRRDVVPLRCGRVSEVHEPVTRVLFSYMCVIGLRFSVLRSYTYGVLSFCVRVSLVQRSENRFWFVYATRVVDSEISQRHSDALALRCMLSERNCIVCCI